MSVMPQMDVYLQRMASDLDRSAESHHLVRRFQAKRKRRNSRDSLTALTAEVGPSLSIVRCLCQLGQHNLLFNICLALI